MYLLGKLKHSGYVFFNVKATSGNSYISRKQKVEKPLLTVKCLPLTLRSQAEEKKLVTPCGLIALNMLKVRYVNVYTVTK